MKYGITAVTLLLAACGPTILPPQEDTGTSTTGPTPDPSTTLATTLPPVGSDDTGSVDSSGGSSSTDSTGAVTSAGFIEDPDGGLPGFPCDFFEQDCPDGEKCMPWANDGGTWNATRCSPIVDDPGQAGEPCMVEGSAVSGIDTCELGAMCWDVDPVTLEGVCVDLCTGSADNPVCEDPSTHCTIGGDASIALCLPKCDPVLQDCSAGQGCYPVGSIFECAPDASGVDGEPGDTCDFINLCDPGTFCANPAINTITCLDQQANGCCVPFCDLGMPSCLNGEMCVPWFEPGDPDGAGLEHVGACSTG